MGNRRPNDEIDKMGIWSRANNHEYDENYKTIIGFGETAMERRIREAKNDKEQKCQKQT